jgi:hypothetical protein
MFSSSRCDLFFSMCSFLCFSVGTSQLRLKVFSPFLFGVLHPPGADPLSHRLLEAGCSENPAQPGFGL